MLNSQPLQPNKLKNKKAPSRESTRKKPGTTGKGEYYHIEVQPNGNFVTFRTQDVGKPGHIQRVAGKRSSGYWSTVKWLIGKSDAHLQGHNLVPDTEAARNVIEQLGSRPIHLIGDRFKAKPRGRLSEEVQQTRVQTQTPKKRKKARPTGSKK